MDSWKQTLAELATARNAALKRHAFLLCGDDSRAEDLVQAAVRRRPRATEGTGPMTIDEEELRRRLEETAAQASSAQFTAGDLVGRIRRRRARVITTAAGAIAAAAAIAVAVPVVLGGAGGSPPVMSHPAPPPPALSYTITVNGQEQVRRPAGPGMPSFAIAPGEKLAITVEVTVPAHVTVTALWLGITNGVLAPRQDGPADMSPILLAHTGTPLLPGVHRFRLHWTAPAALAPGTDRQLSAEFTWPDRTGRPYGGDEGIVAELDVHRGPGA